MKKRLPQLFAIIMLIISFTSLLSWVSPAKPKREIYQLTVYHFTTKEQESVLDNYLQHAFVPALHRMSFKNVGVFKAHANDTTADKLLYVLIQAASTDDILKISAKLNADNTYQTDGAAYINAVYTTPPYTRMETILLQAFPLAPQLQLPALNGPKRDRVYELRSYESATEKIFQNKVQMFNQGDEIGLFKRLNFNASFYAEVIAGSKMPNLMYMTCHENKTAREANWKNFVDDPYWKKLSSMPEYQHNVSHIDITFLYPTEYSDF